MKTQIYLGHRPNRTRCIFRYPMTPTRETHGEEFTYVVGPFRTLAGARFMRDYGQGNPHCRCVSEAERLARKYANTPLTPTT